MDIDDLIRDIEDWSWPYEGTFKDAIVATVNFIRRNYESTEIHYSENSYWDTRNQGIQQDSLEGPVRPWIKSKTKG